MRTTDEPPQTTGIQQRFVCVCRVFKNEAAENISGLFANPPARYSNSRNSQLSLPRPRTDIFKTGIAYSGAFTVE